MSPAKTSSVIVDRLCTVGDPQHQHSMYNKLNSQNGPNSWLSWSGSARLHDWLAGWMLSVLITLFSLATSYPAANGH